MIYLLNKLRLFRLKCRAYVLEACLHDHESQWDDHRRRYLNAIRDKEILYKRTLRELHQVKARMSMLERPEVLLRRIA